MASQNMPPPRLHRTTILVVPFLAYSSGQRSPPHFSILPHVKALHLSHTARDNARHLSHAPHSRTCHVIPRFRSMPQHGTALLECGSAHHRSHLVCSPQHVIAPLVFRSVHDSTRLEITSRLTVPLLENTPYPVQNNTPLCSKAALFTALLVS